MHLYITYNKYTWWVVQSAWTGEKTIEKEKNTTETDSQASTIPGTDEQIATMLMDSKACQTPQDRVRRMPATPHPQPMRLDRRMQSTEILRANSATATTVAETPSPAEASDKQKHSQKPAKKSHKTKKRAKTQKKSVQEKKKLAVKKTQTKTTAKKTDAVQKTDTTKKTPVAAPKSAAAPHAQPPAHPDPGVTTPAASAAPPAVKTAPEKDQKDMASSSQPPHEVKKERDAAGCVKPVQQPAQPVNPEVAPGNTPAKSPAPESVAGLLNRAQTDQFDMGSVQQMLDQVQAHLPRTASGAPAPPSPPGGPTGSNPRIRNRDKNSHNRRMRFYRGLESFLDPTMNTAYNMKSFLVQRAVWDMTWSMLPPSDPD